MGSRPESEGWWSSVACARLVAVEIEMVDVGDAELRNRALESFEGAHLLPLVRAGVEFEDGRPVERTNNDKREAA